MINNINSYRPKKDLAQAKKSLQDIADELKKQYGDKFELSRNIELEALVAEWVYKKGQARRFHKDEDMRKIDIEYSSKIKNFMRSKGIPDVDPVSPPLQIPLSIFSESKVGKKKKT